MIAGGVGDIQRNHLLDVGEAGEAGEIHSLAETQPIAKPRPELLPGEEEASLPAQENPRDPAMLMLSRVLGERLSTDNLAWRGDPIPVMRSLQKLLVGHSLSLQEGEREPAMRAIRTVELAVRWRLRWMQMRRSEAESNFIQQEQGDHATQTTS